MKAGTNVVFIINNKLKEGFIVKNEYNRVLVKTKKRRYYVKPSQIAKKEEK